MNYVLKAIEMAVKAHGEQRDKCGRLYIFHPLHVMLQMKEEDEQCVGVLHDTVEDTALTLKDLERARFPSHIVKAVDAMTKRKGETNMEYWTRVKANPLALRVKLADIAHNCSEARLSELSKEEADYLRKKYQTGLNFLRS